MNKPQLEQFAVTLEERIKQGADYVSPQTLLQLIKIILWEPKD